MSRLNRTVAIPVIVLISVFLGACNDDDPVTPNPSHNTVVQVRVVAGNVSLATATETMTTGSLALAPGVEAVVLVEFLDSYGNPITPLDDEFLAVEVADPTVGGWRTDEAGSFEGYVSGLVAGSTTIHFVLMSGTVGSPEAEAVFTPMGINLIVG